MTETSAAATFGEENILDIRPSMMILLPRIIPVAIIAILIAVMGGSTIQGLMAAIYLNTDEGSAAENLVVTIHKNAHLISAGLVMICFAAVGWWIAVVRSIRVRVSKTRIQVSRGIFFVIEDEIEIGRVRDYRILKPIQRRILGLQDLEIHSTDRSIPILVLPGMKKSGEIRDIVRNLVLERQATMGYREIETT